MKEIAFSKVLIIKKSLSDIKTSLDDEKKFRPLVSEEKAYNAFNKITECISQWDSEKNENLQRIRSLESRVRELENEQMQMLSAQNSLRDATSILMRLRSFVGKVIYSERLINPDLRSEGINILNLSKNSNSAQ